MLETTAVEVSVGMRVVLGIVDLGELQTSVFVELLIMKLLIGTEHLPGETDKSLFEDQHFVFTWPRLALFQTSLFDYRQLYCWVLIGSYLILADPDSGGSAVRQSVQVLSYWRVMVHIEGQYEAAWEHSRHGVIYLGTKTHHF